MPVRHRLMLAGSILLLSLATLTCVQREPTITVGFNQWVGFAPFFLAHESKFYGDAQMDFVFLDLEGDKRAGLYSGRLDVICETIDMFQTERTTSNYPGRIIFAVDESQGGDGVVVSQDIQSIAELSGRVAVSEPGQPAHFILQYVLHEAGLTLEDLRLQTMTSADAAAAFFAGRADVAGTYEPYLSEALDKRAGAHVLASSKDLPGLIVDVCIAREETIRERRADLVALAAGFFRAVESLQNNEAQSIQIMAQAYGMPAEEFSETITGLKYLGKPANLEYFGTPAQPGRIAHVFQLAGSILIENGLTSEVADAEDKISWEIIKAFQD